MSYKSRAPIVTGVVVILLVLAAFGLRRCDPPNPPPRGRIAVELNKERTRLTITGPPTRGYLVLRHREQADIPLTALFQPLVFADPECKRPLTGYIVQGDEGGTVVLPLPEVTGAERLQVEELVHAATLTAAESGTDLAPCLHKGSPIAIFSAVADKKGCSMPAPPDGGRIEFAVCLDPRPSPPPTPSR